MGRRRGKAGSGPHGVLCIDKPAGRTSFQVLRTAERMVGASRAGHAGTLDPAATGVLLVLLGEGTKLSHWVMVHDKSYRATVALGAATDTLDAEGVVVETALVPADALEPARVEAALAGFVGEQLQVPPMYSALKRDGRSLMSRARAGEVFEVEPRAVVCHALRLVEVCGESLVIDIDCGSGYYVRSLARDLGRALGVPAHLAALRRTRLGAFSVDDAVPLDGLGPAAVRPLVDAVPDLPRLVLDAARSDDVRHGRPIPATIDGARAILLDPEGEPLALVERDGADRWIVFRGFRFDAESVPEPAPDAGMC